MTRRNRKPAAQEWTLREMRVLEAHYGRMTRKQLVARYLPNRTVNAIRTRVALAGLQKMPPSPQWNPTEDSLIRRHYERKGGLQLLTRKLSGRTRLSIQQRARKLGLSLNGEPWTAKEEKLLRRLFAKHGYAASIPNRTPDSVRGRAQKLGLHSLPPAPPGSRRGLDWSKEELRILRASRNLSPKALVALLPGRAYRAIIGKRFVLGIGRRAGSGARSAWSAREESILQRHVGAHARDLLPLLPGRTYESIRTRLSKRG